MRKTILLAASVAAVICTSPTAHTQTAPPSSLAEYLALTGEQKEAIAANNAAYTRASLLKQNRLAQVEQEIREETGRDPLSAGALGVRYVEIETACRELADEGRKTRDRNLALLTEAQKTRIKALEEALRLLPLAQESQGAGLVAYDRPLSLLLAVSERPPAAGATGGVFPWPPGIQPVTSCLLNPLGMSVRGAAAAAESAR